MKKLKGDGGFSIVEVIVATAILIIVSAILVGLVMTGMKFYRTHTARVTLQMEAQIVMAQMREYVVDSTGFEPGAAAGTWVIKRDWAVPGKQEITVKYDSTNERLELSENGTDFYELASYVKSFSMTPGKRVDVTLELGKFGGNWGEHQLITRRNP